MEDEFSNRESRVVLVFPEQNNLDQGHFLSFYQPRKPCTNPLVSSLCHSKCKEKIELERFCNYGINIERISEL